MGMRLALAVAGIVTLAAVAPAGAADVRSDWEPPSAFEKRRPPVVEYRSGWYLRGDLGYRYNRVDSFDPPLPGVAITDASVGDRLSIGGGFGYDFGFVRADVTLDHGIQAQVRGGPYSGKLDTVSALGNIYLDLGTWGGVTPYVGVGGGISRLNVTQFYDDTNPIGSTKYDTWRWTWALMGGLSVRLDEHFSIDLGYRYLNLGDAASSNDPTNRVMLKGLTAQEFRLGVRMLID